MSDAFEREVVWPNHRVEKVKAGVKQLCALASVHGLRVELVEKIEIQYDTTRMQVQGIRPGRKWGEVASDVAHEIAHWALASPLQRATLDFGLGWGPDTNPRGSAVCDDVMIVPWFHADYMECMASLFGMVLEAWAGLDPLQETWFWHSWGDGRPVLEVSAAKRATPYLRTMRRLGVLQGGRRRYAMSEESESKTEVELVLDPFRGWRIPFTEVDWCSHLGEELHDSIKP